MKGGQTAAKKLRRVGFLSCGITPELTRRGMQVADMARLAGLIAEALRSNAPEGLAPRVAAWRREFGGLHFIRW